MSHDVVLVPGGGLQADGSVPRWVAARLDAAIQHAGDAPIVTLSAGTPHKPPPIDRLGYPIFEATAGAAYLLAKGVDGSRIYTETASYDTVGNAWFARTVHTDPLGWRRLLIVNSEFHMERTEAVFRWVFGLAPVEGEPYRLEFLITPNVGMDRRVVEARRQRERESLVRIAEVMEPIRDVESFHEWLFTMHGAYKAGREWRPFDVDAAERASY